MVACIKEGPEPMQCSSSSQLSGQEEKNDREEVCKMRSMGGDDLQLDTQDVGFHEERIVVSVRMRPLNSKEILRNDPIDWNCVDENTIIYKNSGPERSNFPNGYTFDRVFQCNCPTKQVYEEAAKKVALSVVSGINASIFAYGQTSSGKTYTMSGVTSYTVEDIYEYINKHTEREFVLKFSAMEIYNEAVRDLLSADGTPLRLLDDPERGTVVDRLTEETLEDLDHLKELLSICETQRQIGETSLNEASSRSHQILRLTIESSTREFVGKGNSSTLAASVDFVDLAGSERASQALSAGTRLKEGCHINRSLLTLGTVIRKLSKGRGGHVPYRDSKLTRILQCSLGGNARTAIICTISPARSHVEQSRNTLQFASCAKEVATNAQVNVVMSDKVLVKQLQRELAKLESELKGAGKPSSTSVPAEIIKEKDLRIEKLETEIKELIRQRDIAQSRLEDLVQVGADDQASGQWEHYDQTLRLRAPLTLSDDDLTSESSGLADRHCLDVGHVGLRTLSSCHSRCSEGNYDDPYLHLPETPVDQFLSDGISPRFSSSHTRFLEADPEEIVRGKMVRRGNEENSGEICKVVRCVEIEKYSTRKTFDSEEMPAVTSTGHGDATDKPLPSPPHKGDRELREVPPKFGLKQALFLSAENGDKFRNVHADSGNNDLSPQEGDNGLGQIPTKVGFGQALFLSPEKGDKELREVQTEYGVDHGSPFSPQKDNKESREVQIKCGADQASYLSPQRTDVEVNSVQIEYHVDEALPLSPKKGDKVLRKAQSESQVDEAFNLSPQKGGKEYAADQALSLSAENRDNESMEIQTEYGVLEMKLQGVQNTTDSLVDPLPNEPSEDTSNPNSLKLTKSRSCRESLVTRSADASPSKEYEKQFPGARMSFQGKISSLHFSPNSSKFSREDSISSEQSVSFDESKGHKSENSSRFTREDSFTSELRSFPRRNMININSSISGLIRNAPELMGLKEMDRLSCAKQGLDYLLEKVSSSSSDTEKSIRYIGLETVEDNRGNYPVDNHTDGNPVGDHKESPSRWPTEFQRQQREIIDLWETCKVSLVHRTYFFLLFKGDPSDSIYMEVELRRLSFLRDRMALGNSGKFVMDGVPDITPASSLRALRRERDMLCKQMQKRLTEGERISLYKKWGIEVNSKQRRQQLARKLWADTEDMDLIMESASLVARLVGLLEPGQALKEMFSLSFSFTPQKMHRRSISWKNSMSSFL